MAGLWLENGLHLQISRSEAKRLAAQMQKDGSADFSGTRIKMVLPNSSEALPRPIDNSKKLVRCSEIAPDSSEPKKTT
jgi:hypothetical protein